ncbi:F-box/FBD/LRR-repeat protein At1g13570-like [Bidens hawaiensis]|uniref:F-box/FBD/LRR-repeat protein At1g13570-like n=1 Tax=Bidens hawaiensis TaxID=980011 RepID=UPI00404A7B7E
MPDDVVTNILDRLPLQDAVRTDVLSKTWRFKWTLLSQLVFDDDFFEYLSKANDENNQVRVIIDRLLVHLRGAITKFVLSDHKVVVEDEDIRHWVSLLSRKRIKDLTLEIFKGTVPYKLPAHLFSCLELKHLTLTDCCFHPPPNFHGFPNLLSLDLYLHSEENSESWEFISRCPLLENLKVDCDLYSSKIKLAEIAKLENLKILSLYLSDLDTMNNFHSSGTTFELLGSLSKLQELKLSFLSCKLTEGDAKWRFSTAFSSLKTLKLANVCLYDGIHLSCAFELIRSCPNLQTLKITAYNSYAGLPTQVDYSTTKQLQLRSVRFKYWNGSENEVCMLKYLLACSPFLKKIAIHPCSHNEIT